jgi:hypothetical protein
MNKYFLSAILFVSVAIAFAQAPQRINYQAVARNTSGALLQNQNIKVKFSIREATPNGTVEYQETHTYNESVWIIHS